MRALLNWAIAAMKKALERHVASKAAGRSLTIYLTERGQSYAN